jgi:hypothetical protein
MTTALTFKFFALQLLLIAAFFPNFFIGSLSYFLPEFIIPARTSNEQPQSPSPHPSPAMSSWFQKTFTLPSRSRGSYLITDHIVSELPEIRNYKVGILHLFIQHTSCALSLNENWDEDVREDMSDALDRIAPADRKGNLYRHSAEGEVYMPVSTCPDR